MALNHYAKAKKLGEKAYREAVSEGSYPYLPALDYILQGKTMLKEVTVGELEIPVNMIVGTYTKGRQEAFARNFMPLLPAASEFGAKWITVFDYQLNEGLHDSIKVYEYIGKFYVAEGNKRVSVMRYLDQPKISASVTRIMPRESDTEEYLLYKEFLKFFRCLGIYDFNFRRQGSYERLAELVGMDLETPWPEQKVRFLKSTFYLFTNIYHSSGGGSLSLTDSEAFLLYLSFYPAESLMTESQKEIRQRIERIWKEFKIKAGGDRIVFSENPNPGSSRRSLLSSILRTNKTFSKSKPLQILFMYDGTPLTSRWNNAHEEGRLLMEKDMRGYVKTTAEVSCGEGESFDALVRSAAEQGVNLIVTTSPSQMEDSLRAAAAWPSLKFINCSVHLHHDLVRTYYGRLYESKFLLGVLAASLSKDHRIGYVAAYPICGALADINAFAIGASMVDPEVKIHLAWSCIKDKNWRDSLYGNGLSIISGPDLVKPSRLDSEYGLFIHHDDGSIQNIASPRWNWNWYYDLIALTMLNGAWDSETSAIGDQALNYWWGMSSGVVDVELTDKVPYSAVNLHSLLKKGIISGTFTPFDGELRSQTGIVKTANDPALSASDIVNINWLNENVIGSIPDMEDLTDTAKKVFRANSFHTPGKAEL